MLRDIFKDWNPEKISQENAEAILSEAGLLFSRLREHRLSHGDLKASNILWYEGNLYLIDLDAAKMHKHERLFKRAHTRDRARFQANWRNLPSSRNFFEPLFK